MKKIILFLIVMNIISFSGISYSQMNRVNKLDTLYQNCLDKGENMYGCVLSYLNNMDSLLNIVNNDLLTKLNDKEKTKLEANNNKWIKEKNPKYKKIENNIDHEGGRDAEMFALDEKAGFVRERVIELIKRVEKLK